MIEERGQDHISARNELPKQLHGVTYWQLGWTGLVFFAGVATTLLFQNWLGREQLTFTTSELISFIFGVALATAAVVLAVAAISLGKASEEAMIRRSDESIRLQNAIFTHTSEALTRIESSTGTTEKRIEDLMTGIRDISVRVAKEVSQDDVVPSPPEPELADRIERSLLQELARLATQQSVSMSAEPKRESSDASAQGAKDPSLVGVTLFSSYEREMDVLLAKLASEPNLEFLKIGRGKTVGKDLEKYTSVYQANDKRVAVVILPSTSFILLQGNERWSGWLNSIELDLATRAIDEFVIAVLGPRSPVADIDLQLKRWVENQSPEMRKHIHLIEGDTEAILNQMRAINVSLQAVPKSGNNA
jgi:hypothetical protein